MILFFENNINLYRTEKKYYEKSLQIAKDLPNSIDEYMNFHLFWRVPGEFGFKQAAAIKSIIVSHKNKLDLITINLWSNVDLRVNEYFKEISRYVNFKIWNLTEEIKNTVLENCHFLQEYNLINDNLCYLESDLFRLLVLHKYGGFYIDMDVLVLRDLSPLNSYEFLYQWGATGFKCFHYNIVNKLRLNNAIMRLNKNSDLSLEFLEILSKTYPEKNSNNWGSVLFLKTNRNNILALPCIWFDSEWGYEDTTFEPFIKHDNIKMFDGSFTWHWHNRWGEEIEEGCKFDIIQKKQNLEFKQLK